MENIKISKMCGLCAGCIRAINTAKTELENGNKVTLFKEIVHNKNVNESLKQLGATFKENIEDLKPESVIIIRAHGEPEQTFTYLNNHNFTYHDCTCPNVKRIHQIVKTQSQTKQIIIVGKRNHPEVAGIAGWCKNKPIIIEHEQDINLLNNFKSQNYYLVCQTTFNKDKFEHMLPQIEVAAKQTNSKLEFENTLCNAQRLINLYSVELAKQSDVMIVVGGKNSSNSNELFNNVKNFCPSIFIEDISTYSQELKNHNIQINKTTHIGITAGASTLKEELIELKKLIESDLK